jgi:hypothetical protein
LYHGKIYRSARWSSNDLRLAFGVAPALKKVAAAGNVVAAFVFACSAAVVVIEE